jgi:hypothetical protein
VAPLLSFTYTGDTYASPLPAVVSVLSKRQQRYATWVFAWGSGTGWVAGG